MAGVGGMCRFARDTLSLDTARQHRTTLFVTSFVTPNRRVFGGIRLRACQAE